MQSYERRARTAEVKLKEPKERLKKKNDELRAAKEQNIILWDNAMAEAELQQQQDQFFKQLAKAIFDTQVLAVQDYLSLTRDKEELKDVFGKGQISYRA